MLLSIGAVSAAEADDASDIVAADDNQEIIQVDNDIGNFSELENYIKSEVDSGNYVIDLNKSYQYVDGDKPVDIISRSNPLTINGNNHILDGSNSDLIFKVWGFSNPVVLSDITFVNARSGQGAIYSLSPNLLIKNCTFENGSGNYGGAMYINGRNTQIIDCTFKNNVASSGGAIQISNNNITISGCTFEGNNATNYGGAINFANFNCNISDSTFRNNHARKSGGAIHAGGNTTISGCTFEDNIASVLGGAIFYNGDNGTILYSQFDGNNASEAGGAIFIQNNSKVMYNNFTNNHVFHTNNLKGGAAVCVMGDLTNITHCRFENNTASHSGGAIFIFSNNNLVSDCYFMNNTAFTEGGAIYDCVSENMEIANSVFIENKAIQCDINAGADQSYGGAIRIHNCVDTYIHDCNFTANRAYHNAGGAIEAHGYNLKVANCNFDKNVAESDGGAMYIPNNGLVNITNCNFTNNYVNDYLTNLVGQSGGAILINHRRQDSNPLTATITKCNFINNSAPYIGGGLVLRTNPTGQVSMMSSNVSDCTFIGNNATWGSAIFLYENVEMNISNVKFGKNRANSTSLVVSADKKVYYYPSDVIITVTLQGKDNIANAIWNGGNHNINDWTTMDVGDVSHVNMKNITYEVYNNTELREVTVYKDGFHNPVSGYENAAVGENIWQDTREDAQNITLKIYKVGENTLSSVKAGILYAQNTETLVAVITAPLTEINGAMQNIQRSLKPGNYTVKASHERDAYYTEIENSTDFEIINPLKLNKTTDDVEVMKGETVTYTITVNNTGDADLDNVCLSEIAPSSFEINKDKVSADWTPNNDGTKFTYNKVLKAHEVTVLTLTYTATEVGVFNNTVVASHNETDLGNTTSGNTTVRAPSTVNGTNDTKTYGQPVNVKVSSENATNVTYVVFDKDNNTVANGTGTLGPNGEFTLTDLPVGNYTVNLTTIPIDEYHNVAYNQSYIKVLPAPSAVEGKDVNVTYGEPIVVPVTSENATNVTYQIIKDGVVIANDTIPVGESINLTSLNLPVGEYTVNLTANVDSNHIPSNNTCKVTVNPAPSTVEGKDVNVTYGQPIEVPITSENATNITYKIIDESGKVVKNGTINPGENITGIDLPVGKYTVNLTTNVDENHIKNTNQSTITVNPAPSAVKGKNITVTVGDPIVVPVTSENATNVTYQIIKDGEVIAKGTVPKGENINLTDLNLPVGEYTVNLTTVVDENHTSANNQSTITVLPIPTHVSVGNVTGRMGENVTIPINVTSDDNKPFNGNVTITLPDGSNQTVEITNGTGNATWLVPDNYVPEYNDTVKFPGNATHLPSNGTGIITVIPIPTHVSVENITAFPDEDVVIPINVTADNNKPFNGNVTITLPDGSNQSVEIVNGTGNATWHVPGNYTPDKYNDTVKFPGDEKYLPSRGNGTVTVVKVPTHVSVGNVTTYPDSDVVIPINVTADDGEPFSGNVTITLPDGSNQTVEFINGTGNAFWHVPEDYAADKYNDTVKFEGFGKYLPSSGNGTITVINVPTHVSVGNVTTYPDSDVVIPINVTADDGEPFSGNVTITLPDGSNQTVEFINGTGNAFWHVPADYKPDNYTDIVKFPGKGKYLPSNGTGIITVVQIPTQISIGNVTAYPDENVTIPVNVTTDDGKPFNGNITVELPGGDYQTVVITNGTGVVTWHVPEDYTPDKYPDSIKFPGNEKYLPSNGNGTITVVKIPTHVSVANVTGRMGENVTIPINVTADDNKPVNGNVTVVLPDGSTQTVKIVNGTGNATWLVPDNYVPQYNDSAKFPGDNIYLPSNGTGIITVVPIPTHVSVGNVTTTPGKKVTIPINVTADDNKPFNGEVTVELPDGSNQTVKITDGQGEVTWKVPSNYKPDTYDDVVKVVGNDKYLPSEGTGTITVVKVPVDIIVGNVTAKPGDDVTIPIKVVPRDGSVFNGKVTVELPDGTIKVVEITDGEGSVDWTVPDDYDGDYPVKVSFDGTDFYYPAEGTGFIKVTPEDPGIITTPENPQKDAPAKSVKSGLAQYETGNPILALLAVLALLGVNTRRRN